MKKQRILLSFLWCLTLSGEQPHYHIFNSRLDYSGFFSVFHSVLGALNFMETDENCCGLGVDFETSGLYYDEKYGDNWWEYYFEPIDVGTKTTNFAYFPYHRQAAFSFSSQYSMSRERGHELIQKYVRIKSHIQEKIDAFYHDHFKGRSTIGIHYRGTDKCHESDIVSYQDAYETVNSLLKKEGESTKVFIATDDADFITYMEAHLPGKIITTESIRSHTGEAIHYAEKEHNYKKGEECLIDCILLSKCTTFVKMDSNLGDCTTKFNPHMPIIELNPKNDAAENSTEQYLRVNYQKGKNNLFQQLAVVLKALEQYEKKACKGVTVDFSPSGDYYSQHKGGNWWEYFFEPLEEGDISGEYTDIPSHEKWIVWHSMYAASPHDMHRLVKKYIKIKPEIMDEASTYKESYLRTSPDSFLIGVSYSKDQFLDEKPPYNEFYKVISVHLREKPNATIFVHTDDKKFHSYLKVKHPDKVFRYDTDSDLHEDKGKNELVNCLLLSESDHLLCTRSRLSIAASWFNPAVPTTEFGLSKILEAGPRTIKKEQ